MAARVVLRGRSAGGILGWINFGLGVLLTWLLIAEIMRMTAPPRPAASPPDVPVVQASPETPARRSRRARLREAMQEERAARERARAARLAAPPAPVVTEDALPLRD